MCWVGTSPGQAGMRPDFSCFAPKMEPEAGIPSKTPKAPIVPIGPGGVSEVEVVPIVPGAPLKTVTSLP